MIHDTSNTATAGVRASHRAGMTVVESMIAVMILSMTTLAVTYAVVAGHAHVANGEDNIRATHLCQDLMEEVLSLPYNDPQGATGMGPDSGETGRSLYDNIDDYHGHSESAGNLTDPLGQSYPSGYAGFTRSATVATTTRVFPGLATLDGVNITVTVQSGGQQWELLRFVAEPES